MIDYAKSMGAKGITISGVCCTSNEVAMRRGIPMAGNFLQQENVVLTGACEAIVVDVQCIFPALGPLSKCFHTKFITTSPICSDARFRIYQNSALDQQEKKQKQIVKTRYVRTSRTENRNLFTYPANETESNRWIFC